MLVDKKILWETQGALSQLSELQIEDERLAYKVGRITDCVAGILKPLAKSNDRLCRKYGIEIKDTKGNGTGRYYIEAGGDAEDDYLKEWDALLDEDPQVKVSAEVDYKRITLEQLKPYTGKIKARSLGELSRWLIEPIDDE